MQKKSLVLFIVLAAIAAALIIFNIFLWQLQQDKKTNIGKLENQIVRHEYENQKLSERNKTLLGKVKDLQSEDAYFAYESKAREEYGMIGDNETFFVLSLDEVKSIPNIKGLQELVQKDGQVNDLATVHNIEANQNNAEPIDLNSVIKLESVTP